MSEKKCNFAAVNVKFDIWKNEICPFGNFSI